MKTLSKISSVLAGLAFCAASHAAAPADAPAGSNGMCKDGSYSTSAEKKGACRGHKGVKEWYAAAAPAASAAPAAAPAPKAAPAPAKAAAPAPMPAPAATPATTAAPAAAAAPAKKVMPAPAATAAPGGGPGMVWANDSSKVYHCSDDKWYGKTKAGTYMSEADAKAKGYHGVRGKACDGK
ncbi:MAG TPA: DUF3761 domain-containing protein [Burkholderiaceae bacterium]